ncbi:Sulfotransferase domain [Dillenia turbinata]|uniref:Sulfotransferase n=1 Tax=Dillenia turbinata TaxID=194707 RepID=A0AAN8V7Y0_9MAGN
MISSLCLRRHFFRLTLLTPCYQNLQESLWIARLSTFAETQMMCLFHERKLGVPEKILFLKYEEMKNAPVKHVKQLAEFLGKPFSPEEEKEGVVQEIVKLCSFEKLTCLEVNKTGKLAFVPELIIGNDNLFRKGQVRDSKNHLTSEMIKRLDKITEEKFKGTGFTFGKSKRH